MRRADMEMFLSCILYLLFSAIAALAPFWRIGFGELVFCSYSSRFFFHVGLLGVFFCVFFRSFLALYIYTGVSFLLLVSGVRSCALEARDGNKVDERVVRKNFTGKLENFIRCFIDIYFLYTVYQCNHGKSISCQVGPLLFFLLPPRQVSRCGIFRIVTILLPFRRNSWV